MDNWQLIYKVYSNYEKNQMFSFHEDDEIENLNALIASNILDPESFHFMKERKSIMQICRDPFTCKGWEFFLGM
jgi:hypothetical protein